MKSQKNEIWKKWYLKKKKMKSQKKWNQKISEHVQCQCQIMSESSYCHSQIKSEPKNKKWNLKEMKSQKK